MTSLAQVCVVYSYKYRYKFNILHYQDSTTKLPFCNKNKPYKLNDLSLSPCICWQFVCASVYLFVVDVEQGWTQNTLQP